MMLLKCWKNKNKYQILKILIVVSSICIFACTVYADVILTDKQYELLIKRLKQDKAIININHIRWNSLKKSKPTITYTVKDGQIVIQSIKIPIYKATPIIYKVKFKIEPSSEQKTYIPISLHLCGMIETRSKVDAKIGIRLLALNPLKIKYFNNINFNILIGIQSSGISIGYTMPKPFKNTTLHLYSGYSYKLQRVYGFGISLNF